MDVKQPLIGILIREMNLEDIPRLSQLLAGLEQAEWVKGLSSREIETILSSRLEKKSAASTILVAVASDDAIAGYGSVHWLPILILPGGEGYISELFVAPEFRGMGVGNSILSEIERLAKEKGCYRLSLLNLRDRESYKRAFYSKRGWAERANAANMIKKLGK